MVGRCHLGVGSRNLAVGADQHRDAFRLFRLCGRRAVRDRHFLAFVAQQIVRKVELLLEMPVVRLRIEANADDDGILIVEFLDSITEPIAFDRSTGCICFRVPPEKNVLPGKTLEVNRRAVLIGQRKRRRRIANFYQSFSYSSSLGPVLEQTQCSSLPGWLKFALQIFIEQAVDDRAIGDRIVGAPRRHAASSVSACDRFAAFSVSPTGVDRPAPKSGR